MRSSQLKVKAVNLLALTALAWPSVAITIIESSCNKWRDRLDHAASEVSGTESLDSRRRSRLQFVLEDDQTKESQTRLGLFPIERNEERSESCSDMTNRFIF